MQGVLVSKLFVATMARYFLFISMLPCDVFHDVMFLSGLVATNCTVPFCQATLTNQFGHVTQHTWNAHGKSCSIFKTNKVFRFAILFNFLRGVYFACESTYLYLLYTSG